MEEGTNLANLEALTNILINLAEIVGLWAGVGPLFFWWIPHANHRYGYRLKLFLTGVSMISVGLAMPYVANFLIATGESGLFIALIVGALVSLCMILTAIALFFLPTIFAFKHQKEKKVWILVLNLFGGMPLVWLIAFIWSCMYDQLLPPKHGETTSLDDR